MNKQEAIELIEKLEEHYGISEGVYLEKRDVINIISQIHEPQKPVISQFVADWVDDSREYRFDFDEWFDCNNQPKIVQLWLNPENKRQAELNVLALVTLIVNGANAVEIEQEKLYTVEIPDPHGIYKIRFLFKTSGGNIRIGGSDRRDIFSNAETHLTESEIKQDFDFLWQFAKEVE